MSVRRACFGLVKRPSHHPGRLRQSSKNEGTTGYEQKIKTNRCLTELLPNRFSQQPADPVALDRPTNFSAGGKSEPADLTVIGPVKNDGPLEARLYSFAPHRSKISPLAQAMGFRKHFRF